REAFRHHPQIGDRDALRRRFPATHHLSEREQAGVAEAGSDILAALAADNQKYVDKFGYIFIVCAAGKSAGEMLALLRHRLDNDPRAEIRIAAEEQARITALRLA
ncbi:MAG TPA: 2-oxo-4-hydroxy-4-carboxy-5-ureidoimidazoline decarboxylase, partial [Vicinamibacterales bacterium]|nr:2-oxo-4-hydroxy-4-carboxy-5-ureidoimidazoline decarboxylase [Vicinamibacterales bacterium]